MDYILIQDQDCHWYVIPKMEKEHWNEWLESEEYNDGIVPDYATEVNGCPSQVVFPDFWID